MKKIGKMVKSDLSNLEVNTNIDFTANFKMDVKIGKGGGGRIFV
jgi:hypothetical protein